MYTTPRIIASLDVALVLGDALGHESGCSDPAGCDT
jgi:hypothetical protein